MMRTVEVFFLPTPFTGVADYMQCITALRSNPSLKRKVKGLETVDQRPEYGKQTCSKLTKISCTACASAVQTTKTESICSLSLAANLRQIFN